ncbi:hypothetical protein PIB30_094903 [Stylosanthes scabra]|uniref:Uncharacterized protein n=1 Tax=Stylosanthes scabra TaxID=79078 RepID=A0ABU6UY89_9FABA|nr:hypothetical protein [Stylosanthes scabra]
MNLNPYLDTKLNAHTRFLFAPSSIQAHHIVPVALNRRGWNKLRVAANGVLIGALGQKLSRFEVADEQWRPNFSEGVRVCAQILVYEKWRKEACGARKKEFGAF